ncbi:class I SAM-dependent methyltransferase [Aggregatilinea lenta]|uniref:class I SAM-dependent methyltransferase n=1 Tax=Aggregatilinea lenta TaxID=913108 RepID=UPI000E5C55E4|nr:class I SAM-dependent methyltransferase [Aggregatilinea lenta]
MNNAEQIDQAIGAISGGRVLDIATGTGSTIQWMIEALKDYEWFLGVDSVDITLRTFEDENVFESDDVEFQRMDAHHLELNDASFDTVTTTRSLHHFADPAQVMDEIMRVLRPGGHVLIGDMYSDNQTETQMTHVLAHHWWARIDAALGIDHTETYTRQQIVDLVEGMGLSRVEYYDYADLGGEATDIARTEFTKRQIARYLDKAKDLPNFDAIQAEAEVLLRRLDEVGVHGATMLFAIGEK